MDQNPPNSPHPLQTQNQSQAPKLTLQTSKKSSLPTILVISGSIGLIFSLIFSFSTIITVTNLSTLNENLGNTPSFLPYISLGIILFLSLLNITIIIFGVKIKKHSTPQPNDKRYAISLVILNFIFGLLFITTFIYTTLFSVYETITEIEDSNEPNRLTISPTPTLKTTESQILQNQDFQTRMYTSTEVQEFEEKWKIPFPSQITQLQDTDLQPIQCTTTLFDNLNNPESNTYTYYDPNIKNPTQSEIIDLTNSPYLDVTQHNISQTGGFLNHMLFCHTQEEAIYSMFAVIPPDVPCGGGVCMEFYFSKHNLSQPNTNSIIKAEGFHPGAYPRCDNPLVLSKSDLLYWQCNGGDGGSASESVVKIDFNTNSFQTVSDCTSYITETGQQQITCN